MLTIPKKLFDVFLAYFSKEQKNYFSSKISKKPSNWGASLGGKTTAEKHPEQLAKGRALGLKKAIKKRREVSLKYKFDLNMELSNNLCEFIGALIGDGFTSKYGKTYWTELTGDLTLDYNYLTNVMTDYSILLFNGLAPRTTIVKKKNTIRKIFHSKQLHQILTQRFGFPAGVKCYTIKIPEEIMNSKEEFIFSTIRGIFDTDGCVFFDKRKIYNKAYPRIVLQTTSEQLYLQLRRFLKKHFSLYARKKSTREIYIVEIYGNKNLKKWMKLIGFSNKRHLSKIEEYFKPERGVEPLTSSSLTLK
ncbi:MAG: LAGLIDADG family homing endonuclease [Candidatus Micrarchaeota archaeon]